MGDLKRFFDDREFKSRHDKLLQKLVHIDLSIIFGRADLTYYSSIGLDGVILVDDKMAHYVRRNLPFAKEESVLDVDLLPSYRKFKDLGKMRKVTSLGLELDLVPFKTVDYITKAFGKPKIIDISTELRLLRSVKSTHEQALMQQAADQTDASFEHAKEVLQVGMTELELSAEIEFFLRKEGHPGYIQTRTFHHNYTTRAYVMTGKSIRSLNSKFGPVTGNGLCRMHINGPSRRKIKRNEPIMIDTTGVYEGYTADETRTFSIGELDVELVNAYELAKDIQTKTASLLVDGVPASAVYHELQEMVITSGFEKNFMGSEEDKVEFIGHGVGLEIDELPLIAPSFNEELVEGQIVAIEPKFLFSDPEGGVGIEDTWVVGQQRARKLTNFPWEDDFTE
ncbi:MAG: M24 family metallopeptidase [Candidatus Kariarchaeaceae archaeon]|jgi:Xaa-Pro aminopeptidase